MLSEDGEGCAMFLIEYHTLYGYPNEVDLFLAQAVLQFLCYQKHRTANVCFGQYTLKHPDIPESEPPFGLPLLNFLWLLLLSIDIGKVQHYTILLEQYQPCLQRDPNYMGYLDKIGQVFFGLPPPKSKQKNAGGGGGGMLMDMIKGLLGEDEPMEDGEEDDFQSIPSSPLPNSDFVTENNASSSSLTGNSNSATVRNSNSKKKVMEVADLD